MKQSSSSRPAVGDRAAGPDGAVPLGGGPGSASAGGGQRSAEGAGQVRYVVDQPIDMVGLLAAGHHPAAGAVVLFSGEVRESNRGKAVTFLEYEAQLTLAEKMMSAILAEAKERWGLSVAVAQHRIGRVAVGETAVVVITASAHRGEAYEANRHIIDRIKHEAPIWKCEHFTDGTSEWGNNCNCHEVTGDVRKHVYESER